MQFPESWLREFCDPPLSTQQLADRLTMAGFEVESLQAVAPPFSGVVVARIVSAEPHPQADRLRICQVDAGGPALLQVVCGAPNARAGLVAPLATVGAVLPGVGAGTAAAPAAAAPIGVGMLRGVASHGMLCSARELRLADDHGGLLELDPAAPAGADLRQWLNLDDTLFTLKLTPNLAHALSVFGIAREVAALTGAPLREPAIEPVQPQHEQRLPVEVVDADLCGRFSGRVVRGVDTCAATPRWMIDRLVRCGQRSVSALVDISNYVMFELGRPSHIFDLDKIHDKLVVRWGRQGESLELLNGDTVEVDADVGVIADAAQVESLAGIMGGQATAVSDATQNVYIEAAFWWPEAVQGRSRRYGFSTDAGHRFERGVDPASTVLHVERITRLVQQVCGGSAGPIDDHVLRVPEAAPVTLRVERAARVVGMPLSQAQCVGALRSLGLACSEAPGRITVTPPSWRFDLKIEEDLIEEVIRVVGYDHLPTAPPLAPVAPLPRPEGRRSAHALRHAVAARGYRETIGFSFVEARWEHELAANADPIKVLNPIAAPLSVMRSTLVGSLLQVLRHNLARRATRVRIFEIGRVFRRNPAAAAGPLAVAGVEQPQRLAGLAYGPADELQWGVKERAADFYDVKGDVESLLASRSPVFVPAEHPALHPGRCARVEVDGVAVGHVGELHPRWRQGWDLPHAPVLFELNLEAMLALKVPEFAPVPRQQPVSRDLAIVVGENVAHDALIAVLRADPARLVQSARLFDVYKPPAGTGAGGLRPGERSLAVRLELLDFDATLTEERIEASVDAAVARVRDAFGARLRAAA